MSGLKKQGGNRVPAPQNTGGTEDPDIDSPKRVRRRRIPKNPKRERTTEGDLATPRDVKITKS